MVERVQRGGVGSRGPPAHFLPRKAVVPERAGLVDTDGDWARGSGSLGVLPPQSLQMVSRT